MGKIHKKEDRNDKNVIHEGFGDPNILKRFVKKK